MHKAIIMQLDDEIRELFDSFNLKDLKYKLEYDLDKQLIEIKPIREIDKFALYGIKNL